MQTSPHSPPADPIIIMTVMIFLSLVKRQYYRLLLLSLVINTERDKNSNIAERSRNHTKPMQYNKWL